MILKNEIIQFLAIIGHSLEQNYNPKSWQVTGHSSKESYIKSTLIFFQRMLKKTLKTLDYSHFSKCAFIIICPSTPKRKMHHLLSKGEQGTPWFILSWNILGRTWLLMHRKFLQAIWKIVFLHDTVKRP